MNDAAKACFLLPRRRESLESELLLSAAETLARRHREAGWNVRWMALGSDADRPSLREPAAPAPAEAPDIPSVAVPPINGVVAHAAEPAYRLHEWLKDEPHARVVAVDSPGALYYALAARHCGAAHADTEFWVLGTETAAWARHADADVVSEPSALATLFIDRRGLRGADRVIVPSERCLSAYTKAPATAEELRSVATPELFAADRPIAETGSRGDSPLRIVVAGLEDSAPGRRFALDVLRRLKRGRADLPPVEFLMVRDVGRRERRDITSRTADAGHRAAVKQIGVATVWDELAREDTLVLLPWPTASRSATLLGCASRGVAFIAVEHPAAVALLGDEARGDALLPLNPNVWADRISRALDGDVPTARLEAEVQRRVSHGSELSLTPAPRPPGPVHARATPTVSICLMHFERPHTLDLALRSIESQDYPELEVVLLDDGSRSPEACEKLDRLEVDFAKRGWRVVRQDNRYLGAARNAAAAAAGGTYLFFLDDDNALKPGAIAQLVDAAERTGADAVVSFADLFETDEPPTRATARHIPLGDCVGLGVFLNAFGDSNALLRRDTFLRIGGNREEYGVGKEDQEFFARLVLSGHKLILLPEAVYWYRQSPGRLRSRHYAQYAGDLRILEAYADAGPPWAEEALLLAQGLLRQRAARWTRSTDGADAGGALLEASDATLQIPGLHRFFRRVLDAETRAFGTILTMQAGAARRVASLIRAARRRVR